MTMDYDLILRSFGVYGHTKLWMRTASDYYDGRLIVNSRLVAPVKFLPVPIWMTHLDSWAGYQNRYCPGALRRVDFCVLEFHNPANYGGGVSCAPFCTRGCPALFFPF
jgi:hypothetical protein